ALGSPRIDALVGMYVEKRFAVRDHEDLITQQLFAQYPAQHFRAPGRAPVGIAPGEIEVAEHRAQIARQRMQIVRSGLGEWLHDAFPAQKCTHPSSPPSPSQLSEAPC